MQGKQRGTALPQYRSRSGQWRKPTSKELDLWLLAGCSCLLTVLYHPVANALHAPSATKSGSAIAATAPAASTNPMNAFHLVVPSQDDRREDEEP